MHHRFLYILHPLAEFHDIMAGFFDQNDDGVSVMHNADAGAVIQAINECDSGPQAVHAILLHGGYMGDFQAALGKLDSGHGVIHVFCDKGGHSDDSTCAVPVCFHTIPYPYRAGRIVSDINRVFSDKTQTLPDQVTFLNGTVWTPDDMIIEVNTAQGQKTVRLTEKENAILYTLYTRHDAGPVSRQDMLDAVWGFAEGVETHTLETHMHRLRKKVQDERGGADQQIIVTTKDGYALNIR